jgi:uncharacterized protein
VFPFFAIFAGKPEDLSMKTLQAIALLLVLSCTQAHCQSVLWEVSGNGLTKPSYLFGTLKFVGEKEFRLPTEALEKLKSVKIFAIEDQVDHHAQHELNKAIHFPEGKSLKTELTPEQYKTVTDFFQREFGINASRFDAHYAKLTPLALSISMTRLSLGEKVRFPDIELLKAAKKQKVETYSLEPIEREAEALRSYAIADQITALMHSIANFETQKNEFKLLVAEYPAGDLNKMFEYTLHPFENNASFIEAFYFKRNEEWLPKLDKMMHEKPSFVAVGVSHLEGERGLLSLLRSKGFTVTPVPVK